MKTPPLSLASTLLLAAACFNPSGSDPTTGTTATGGPATSDGPGGPGSTASGEGDTLSSGAPTSGEPVTTTAATGDTSSGTGTTGEPCDADVCPCDSATECAAGQQCLDGACVECIDSTTCNGRVCDPIAHVCRDCREHSECPKTACELDDGVCFPVVATSHAHVDPGLTCGDQPCTADQPCCSIGQAMTQYIDASHLVVHLGPGTYMSGVRLVEGGRKVAVLGSELTVFEVSGEPAVRLGDEMQADAIDSELYVADIRIEGGTGEAAIRCKSAAQLWLDDVRIESYVGRAISTSECVAMVRRSELALNVHAIAIDQGSTLQLENTLVAHYNMGAALEVGVTSGAHLLYTTLGDATQHAAGLFACVDGTAMLSARNSALLSHGLGGTFSCASSSLQLTDSVVSDSTLENVDTNVAVIQPQQVAPLFQGWGGGDLHVLGDGGLLAGKARWKQGDPGTDVDGDPRPMMDGAPDVAGGDRPPG
ncbi:hypothetical protein [Nannocystis punicea]|uniref:Right handed beta helix region n=1 Tax=Nannocystis punicea TaxID=2995304 RepID=A0ABY7GTB5_9BACT|nr:hypothetical protein [Nannocystis poenicansa]WAS90099.1 hypothetical protein O0S08_28225 [Nannocystis poenicansa]